MHSIVHLTFFLLNSETVITCAESLALHIFHQVDEGESDPARLADSAILSLLRWRSEVQGRES
jgi:hypothetical protein